MMLPVWFFKEIKVCLTQQKNYLDLKTQTWVQPRNIPNDSLNEELKVWSLPDCRGRTGKIKETRGMSSSQEQGAFVREGKGKELQRAGSCIAGAGVGVFVKLLLALQPGSAAKFLRPR